MPSFNLIDEDWVPCVLADGSSKLLGLRDALTNSHDIKEISDSSPLVVVAILRLMLAILHGNFGPENMSRWLALWQAGKWDAAELAAYFETWRHRFDLFDQDRPFYQSRELRGAERHPVLHLATEVSSGNNPTLFDHSSDDSPPAVTPDVAARYVLATQAYSIGGGVSTPFNLSDSPLTRGVSVFAVGDNLFQTLALNLIEYNESLPLERSGPDVPIWENDYPEEPYSAGTPTKGYLDYLTWQSRNIHLFPEGDPVGVRYCQIQQRLKLPKQQYLDPFKCFQRGEKGLVPKALSADRAVWRDSHALLQKADSDFKRPEVFNWLARVDDRRRAGQIDARPEYQVVVAGLATAPGKAASVLLWRHERLPLPLKYLEDERLIATLEEALHLAEGVGRLLGAGCVQVQGKTKRFQVPSPMWLLAQEVLAKDQNGKADSNAVRSFVASLSPTRSYWASLGISFNHLVTELPADTSPDGEYGASVLLRWAREVGRAARQAFRQATDSLDHSGRWLKAVSIAQDSFKRLLNSTINEFTAPYQQETEERGGE